MQHMINKAYTRWVAANLISGHLVHAGNHRHGTAGHSQGQCSLSKSKKKCFSNALGYTLVVLEVL